MRRDRLSCPRANNDDKMESSVPRRVARPRRSGDVTASSSDVTPTSSESDDDDAPVLVIPRTSRSVRHASAVYYHYLLLTTTTVAAVILVASNACKCKQSASPYYGSCIRSPHFFSALTLLVGRQEGIRPVKNRVVGCWCGCLSGARCRLAYGPADATATHCLLLQ